MPLTVGVIEGMAQLAYRVTCGEAYKESHFNSRGNEVLAEQMLARIVETTDTPGLESQ